MTPPSRFKRIAHDLERLPCELHEAVLVELEFHQLIRLSQYAGPRLHWSLEHSPSSWGVYFKHGSIADLQRFLAITDRIKRFYFKLPTTKGKEPHVFREGDLSFLQQRNSGWESKSDYPRCYGKDFPSYDAVSRHWLQSLNYLVLNATWVAFHEGFQKFTKPWIATIDGALEVFQKIPNIGDPTERYDLPEHAMREAFSFHEMCKFVNIYQTLRLVRAEALSSELCKLADIYEADPSILKTPFAPQTPRRNVRHIPDNLRFEARKIIKKAKFGRWSEKETSIYRFRYPFPALVPYNWTSEFFNSHSVSDPDSQPEEITEKVCIVRRSAPTWMTNTKLSLEQRFETMDISKAVKHRTIGEAGASLCKPVVKEDGDTYLPHPEDVEWLETFAEVTAWLEEHFPTDAKEVRGEDWEACKGNK